MLSDFIIVFFASLSFPLPFLSISPPRSPHILMLLSPLRAGCDCGGQAPSNLSQMSLKNTGPLRRLLSPLTGRPIASLCDQEAVLRFNSVSALAEQTGQ